MGITITISVTNTIRRSKKFDKNFDTLTYHNEINSSITQINILEKVRHSPSVVYLTFSNNKKYRINTLEDENWQKNIAYVINIGDRIVKKRDNDSLFLIKDSMNDTLIYMLESYK